MSSCILAKPGKSHAEDIVTFSRKELIRGFAKSSRAVALFGATATIRLVSLVEKRKTVKKETNEF